MRLRTIGLIIESAGYALVIANVLIISYLIYQAALLWLANGGMI